MKKGFFVLLVVLLLVFTVVPTFAEEAGSAIGTFGFGITKFSKNDFNGTYTVVSFDLDLVSKQGLTVSFGNMVNFKINEAIYNFPYIGFGYRYLADKWDLGLSVITIPVEVISDALVGLKVSGGYWMTSSFGLTLTAMYGIGAVTDLSAFSVRPGFSVRL